MIGSERSASRGINVFEHYPRWRPNSLAVPVIGLSALMSSNEHGHTGSGLLRDGSESGTATGEPTYDNASLSLWFMRRHLHKRGTGALFPM